MKRSVSLDNLLENAKNVLNLNYNIKGFTVPSKNLYPHQWSWDSCWIANAYLVLREFEKAEKEMINLFKFQWLNGLVPSIVFHELSDKTYFPGPQYWELKKKTKNLIVNENCTGIVQPPIHSLTCLKIYKYTKNKDFLNYMYPKLLKWHRYLYNERDVNNEGLVYIRHPWESGMDNSPNWDKSLERIRIHEFKYSKLRTDNKKVNSNERPTDITYERYLKLIEIFKSCCFNEESIYKNSEFIIQDVLFNVLLMISNNALLEISNILKIDNDEIKRWIYLSNSNFNKFYLDGFYYDYDLKTNNHIIEKTISGLSPIALNLNSKSLIEVLKEEFLDIENNNYRISSISRKSKKYDSVNYWRGPMWLNLTWLLANNIGNIDIELKESLLNECINCVKNGGFYEYFDSLENSNMGQILGCGDDNFSWTAAIVICLIKNFKLI